MTEPTTEAGRRLFTDMEPMDMWESTVTPADVLAIESEARADALREAAQRVRALMATAEPEPDDTPEMQAYERVVGATIRAILAETEG